MLRFHCTWVNFGCHHFLFKSEYFENAHPFEEKENHDIKATGPKI